MCETSQLIAWTMALNLPGYEVSHYAEDGIDGVLRLSVVPTQIIELCPDCGRPCDSWHQKRWLENVLDLSLGGRPVCLKVRVFQYQCEHCGRMWTPHSPIVAEGTWATARLVARAAELVRRSDVANAAAFFGIPEKTLERWYYDYVECQRTVTVDRFHVMQNFQERLTDARREIQRGLSKEEAKSLKGSRWLWLTNEENLTTEERQELEGLCRQFPRLGALRQQRETLRQIFEDRRLQTAEGGERRLQDWIVQSRQLGLDALNAFCQTLENWLDKIANYFINRSTNGPTEGFNHGLRAILWRAFGMTNFQHFRARVLHTFGNPKPQ